MNHNQQFADLLGYWMKKRQLNGAELARRLGIHRSAPSRWLKGEILPDRSTVRQIADLLMLCGSDRQTFFMAWLGEQDL
jgi:transcriptional regulator with XRE-family HTH domain